jgi:outer membrane protein OmpA-like peptidoglycan-associated protein
MLHWFGQKVKSGCKRLIYNNIQTFDFSFFYCIFPVISCYPILNSNNLSQKLNLKSMSFNLIEAAKSLFTSELISKASSSLGESQGSISKAISGIIPTIFSGLLNKTSTAEGAGTVASMVEEQQNAGIINNLAGFFGEEAGGLPGKGAGLLSWLFGNQTESVSNLVSGFSGVKPSSIASLMSMALPAVLGIIGKHTPGNSADSISSFLNSQKENIASAVPYGLNPGGLLSAANTPVSAPAATQSEVTGGSESGSKILLPLLLLAAVAIGAWYFIQKGCNNESANTSATSADTSKHSEITGTDTSKNSNQTTVNTGIKESLKVKLANGTEIDAYKGGIEDKLVAFLGTEWTKLGADSLKKIWFDFDNLNFETGKSILLPESEKQLENIAAILKAYPAARVKIGGYTDKTGNEEANLKLSGERANAAKIGLEKRGVAAQITGAEGYGSSMAKYPATAPETDRVKDRHVSLSIRQ